MFIKIEFSKIEEQAGQDLGPHFSFSLCNFSISLSIKACKLSSLSDVKFGLNCEKWMLLVGIFLAMFDDNLEGAEVVDWRV